MNDTQTLMPPHTAPTAVPPSAEINRPIYVRRVPESVWLRVHENALRSRLRLQDYLVRIMADSEPFAPAPR